jgi:hypothetical protein
MPGGSKSGGAVKVEQKKLRRPLSLQPSIPQLLVLSGRFHHSLPDLGFDIFSTHTYICDASF